MKRLLLLAFLLCGECMFAPILYCQERPVSVVRDQEVPELELDGDIFITSDDEDMLAFLAQAPEEPSILWTLFCTVGSTALAKLIYAKRYVDRLMSRMQTWLHSRMGRIEQQKQ